MNIRPDSLSAPHISMRMFCDVCLENTVDNAYSGIFLFISAIELAER